VIDFKLPSLGADMEEGTLIEWKVTPGDPIARGQIIAIVDTTKAAVEVESWEEGTVHALLVDPGDTVPVGAVIARLLAPGEEAGAAAPPPVAPAAERRRVSPAARRRAQELGVDADTVSGTGPGGAVTVDDVERARPGAAPVAAAFRDRAAAMRGAIAAAMSRSNREIPHYYLAEPVPLQRASEWLARANAARAVPERLLMAVVLLKAVARALGNFPELNGFYRDNGLQASAAVHVGVAIRQRVGGLIAPALHDVERKSLTVLMSELSDLVARARAGTLRSSELADATITVTNLGEQSVERVFGVIYPPQVALVGFGGIARRPWVLDDGSVAALPVVTATLSADHRVSDGYRGALFLAALRDALQEPESLAE
jgi:pyruvate dehydrogenase E2 component (dihydrolipoamide acetyltransferase)